MTPFVPPAPTALQSQLRGEPPSLGEAARLLELAAVVEGSRAIFGDGAAIDMLFVGKELRPRYGDWPRLLIDVVVFEPFGDESPIIIPGESPNVTPTVAEMAALIDRRQRLEAAAPEGVTVDGESYTVGLRPIHSRTVRGLRLAFTLHADADPRPDANPASAPGEG